MIAKDGSRLPLEVSTEAMLRDGRPVEIQGVAVLAVISNQSPSDARPHCFD